MTDLIEKIGRFFAEQEAQIQETFSHVAQVPARVSLPLSKPQPPVHRIPAHPHDHPPEFGRESPVSNPVPKLPRSNSLVRRRLSLKSAAEPNTMPQPQTLQENTSHLFNATQRSKSHDESSLRFSIPARPPLPLGDTWNQDDLLSWGSASSLVPTVSSRGSSTRDEDLTSHTSSDAPDSQRKPRPPQQKHRKRSRKKKRSNNQEEDPKAVAKANAEKVAAALTLAQERAKRFQQEKLQLEREIELERQAAAFHLQEQMIKIEAVRAKSFRHPSSSPMITARSVNTESNYDTESVWTADTNGLMELQQKLSSQFMVELEAQLREKMSLEMHVKQNYIQKHKQRERVRLKLDKVLQFNADHSSKVARLSAMKASLEMELAAVLEETTQTRQQRRDLELADEKERLKRQREAERSLQIRLREEEWNSMMKEEKARSQVAAQARAKASKRVEAHSAKLRRMLHAYRYQPHHSSSSGVSSSAKSNNDSDHSDEENNVSSSHGSEDLLNKPTHSFKMDFFLPPELADFEEDGLCNNNEDSTKTDYDKPAITTDVLFKWEVPNFSDSTTFRQVLLDLVSDDEDE